MTSIGGSAFYGCTGLSELSLPSGVTSIGNSAFYCCTGLSRMTVPSGVTLIGAETFRGCTGLSEVSLPEGVTSVGNYAFYGCTGLVDVSIPGGVTNIGSSAFCDCTGLERVDIPDGVTEIGNYAFYNCTNLAAVAIPSGLKRLRDSTFNNCRRLAEVTIPAAVTDIDGYAFGSCVGLTKVVVCNSSAAISDYAFKYCENVVDVTVPQCVCDGRFYLFPSYQSITNVTILDGVTRIGNATFSGRSAIRRVTIPGSVTSIGGSAFYGCTGLSELSLPSGVTSIGNSAFYCCTGLSRMTVPSGVTLIGAETFRGCTGLSEVSLPEGVTSVGNYAFYGCTGLVDVSIPGGVTNIGSSAFCDCTGLERVDIPDGVTEIGSSAFYGCTKIESVQLGAGLTSIGSSAFSGCTNAFTFAFAGTPPSVGSSAFNKVKSGAVGTYTAAHAAEWEAVIGMDGKWNGLIMKANKPILSNGGCNVAAGEFTLTWANDNAPMPSDMTYEIRRGFSDNYGASEMLTHGYTGLSFVDKDFYTTGGVSRIWYWVKPEHQLFEPSEPIVTRTRHAIAVGLSKWDEEIFANTDTGGALNAQHFAELALKLGGFEDRILVCTDAEAKTNDVSNAFVAVAADALPGDICVFYINTHGGVDNGITSLALYDGEYTEMQLSQDISLLSDKSLSVVGIVSACHSGGLYDNPDESVSRTSWYLRENLAQCSPNIAWITSASAETSGSSRFSKFFLEYGWERGWAGDDKSISILQLANYAKERYDALYTGFRFDGDLASPSVSILNDVILSRVVFNNGNGENVLPSPPCAPSNVKVSEGEYRDRIQVSWDVDTSAAWYQVFFGYAEYAEGDAHYIGFREPLDWEIYGNKVTMDFETSKYDWMSYSSENARVYFVVRAVNGAGVASSAIVEGWIDDRYAVTFKADGLIDVPDCGWYGVWPTTVTDPLSNRTRASMEKRFAIGESLKIEIWPSVVRDGFTFVGWRDGRFRLWRTNDVLSVSSSMTFTPEMTAMTTTYLDQHSNIAAASGGDIATAAAMPAANGCRTVGECYALGIDPEDPNDDFKITDFKIEDGKPVITLNHTKDGSGNSFEPRIKTLGKANLTDSDWVDVTDKDQSPYRFFKVTVDMP